jgi:YesN/AraC family two-component response regulator
MTTPDKIQEPLSVTTSNKLATISSLQQEKEESILIVEDEAGIRYLLKDILKDHYTLYEAENGKEALELLANTHPHLIISDIMMPDMNGLELCNTVKNAPSTCHIPFIILSAKGNIEHQTEGYEVGADAYIAKPFHINYLKVRVRKLLEYHKRVQELFRADSLLDYNTEPELTDTDKKFLSSVVAIIEEHLDDADFNTTELEKSLNLSKMQLYRRLKTLTQMTPGEFIKNIRLKHAAHLLTTTQLTVMEIFYRTGFNNQSYFYREFKKRYSCAPNEYRGK